MIRGYNTLESEPSPRDDLAIGLRPFLFMGSGGEFEHRGGKLLQHLK